MSVVVTLSTSIDNIKKKEEAHLVQAFSIRNKSIHVTLNGIFNDRGIGTIYVIKRS